MKLTRLYKPLPIVAGVLFISTLVLFQNCGGSFKVENLIPASPQSQSITPADASSTSADAPAAEAADTDKANEQASGANSEEAVCLPTIQTLVVANTSATAGAAISNASSPASVTVPGNYTFIVPAGITEITVKAWGGGGGSGGASAGGGGAYATGKIAVTPGEVLEVGVAQGGQAQAELQNHIFGGGGGGMSYLQRVSNGQMLVIAAGGGGAGLDGNLGRVGLNANGAGGAGGATSGSAGGDASVADFGSGTGGAGATQIAPGAAGLVTLIGANGDQPASGKPGSFFVGGFSADYGSSSNRWKGGTQVANGAGGGGGAGLYGGGSGSSLYTHWGAGGGGGSSYIVPSATASALSAGQGRNVANSNDEQLPTGHGNGGLNGITNEVVQNQGVPMAGQPGYVNISW